jgi:hypothetical protein
MKIYSNTLQPADLHRASMGLPLYCSEIKPMLRPKLRTRGYKVHVLGYSRRSTNTGTHGASGESAATWDAHGQFFARVFALDPAALIVASLRYDGARDFHTQTANEYHPIGAWYDDPERVEKGD